MANNGALHGLLDHADVLNRSGKHDKAECLCHLVLKSDGNNIEALYLLAAICYQQKRYQNALDVYQRILQIEPRLGFVRINLALVQQELGLLEEALTSFGEAEQIDGASVALYYNRAVLFQRLERLEDASHDFNHALALDPRHIGSWINQSAVYLAQNDSDGAIHSCRHGLFLEPQNIALTANLATAYSKAYRFDESLAWHQRLLELAPEEDRAEALGRKANCLNSLWRVDEAISCFNQAISVACDAHQKCSLASTRLFVLHYSPAWSSSAIADEHLRWGACYFPPAPIKQFNNSRDPNRPLKVAYLSPDLRIHAVVFFLQPVLAAHDSAQTTVYCYSDVKKPDAVTFQLKEQHEVIWRDCAGLDDDTVMRMLHNDQIDILVDLAGHTATNRLPLFARRVAPLQISWIGYPNTTGLAEMDYRITDQYADPPGMTEHLHSEKLLRLPDSFLCYRPGADFPDPASLPFHLNGHITFGTFSNFMKVNATMLRLWARILAAVPDSRLYLRARGLTESRFQSEIAPLFILHGVKPERVTILGHVGSVVENIQDYGKIDIALDTFPYNGTTTTCESLCMGVPVVTMAGASHVSRVGASLLHSAGFPEFIADSPERYFAIATRLADDILGLVELRKRLRERLLASPLTDNVTFTRNLEDLYRQIWQRWCSKKSK